jgi:serine O-acetyltransferase
MRFAAEGNPVVARVARWRLRRYGCDVDRGAVLGGRISVVHATGIVIASNVVLGDRVRLFHSITLGEHNGGWPTLHDQVRVMPGAVVVGAITVGHGAAIGANSYVCADVPAHAIVPAATRWTRSTLEAYSNPTAT